LSRTSIVSPPEWTASSIFRTFVITVTGAGP
jgi:hypothetical protein